MKYLFENLECDVSQLQAISNQIAFSFSDLNWRTMRQDDVVKVIAYEEPRINVNKVDKTDDRIVVCFDNEELKGEFRRLF
jgi:ribosome maturation factor RimP